ncbi:hypothetical protein CVT24_004796 [Panaeolus cyanescens]|uniref:Deacetylase sirtuin-type domain-containing protein n=1 Tax=Panaeolus cyanescens TaxID=181874 RepID=A0A409VQ17_9AGAR|nr:hypothetical protein CVT24_004796 [Panaeolus cyanescens]
MSFRYGKHDSRKPKVLKRRDIPSLAKYIKSERCKNVFFMIGAGISTSAGIPDFRSPKTGLYANLARLNLPHPEAVFEIGFFRRNPVPFYTLAHELYPGKFRPTLSHSFIRLIAEKGLLHTCYTQNIDTLERRAGVPEDKIIEAHGSFATQRCIDCRKPFDDALMKEHIMAKKIAKCPHCSGYVKPDIVFFGEGLPPHFINSLNSLLDADLLIIMGTSLTVHPFASLAEIPPQSCPRVLINMEPVGDIGDNPDDLLLLGQCDQIVEELCKELGWHDDLQRLWADTEGSVISDTQPEEGKEKEGAAKKDSAEDKGNVDDALAEAEARLAALVVAEKEVLGEKDTKAEENPTTSTSTVAPGVVVEEKPATTSSPSTTPSQATPEEASKKEVAEKEQKL